MSVTESLMQVGSWNLKLDNAPIDVRRQFDWFGNIVITAARIKDPNVSFANLVAAAIYSGIVLKRNQGEGRYGGPGLLGYLQTGRGHAADLAGFPPSFPADFGDILTDYLAGDESSNGLTVGSASSMTATTIDTIIALGTTRPPTKPIIDDAAAMTGNEYVVRPDGSVDYGLNTALFRNTPTVLLSPELRGRDQYTALEVDQWSVDQDIMDYRNVGLSESADFSYATVEYGTSSIMPLYCWGGSGVGEITLADRFDSNTNDHSDVDAVAQAGANEFGEVNFRLSCSVKDFCVPRLLIPGDWVYVHDVDNDLTGSTEVIHFGRSVFPQKIRCMGYTWPIQPGMGVYAVNNQTQAITDVTDFVSWETGTTKIDLGSPPKKLNTNPNVSRYKQ